jgi:hypothetical protein
MYVSEFWVKTERDEDVFEAMHVGTVLNLILQMI